MPQERATSLSSFLGFFITAFLFSVHQLLIVSYSTRTFSDIIRENSFSSEITFFFSPPNSHIQPMPKALGNSTSELSFAFLSFTGFTFPSPLDINSTSALKTPQSCHSAARSGAPEVTLSLPQILIFISQNVTKLWQCISSLEPVTCLLQKIFTALNFTTFF